MGKQRYEVRVTILSGQSLSNDVNINQHRIVGVRMPAAWDAAALQLQGLVDPAAAIPAFGNMVDQAAAALSLASGTALAGLYIAIPDTAALRGLGRIKVRSGTNAAPVNQTADRVLHLVLVED